MIKIIETNLLINLVGEIKDHQARVIEVESWEEYIQEIKDVKSVSRNCFIGILHGTTIPREVGVENLVYDDDHLSYYIINEYGIPSKKLAYKA